MRPIRLATAVLTGAIMTTPVFIGCDNPEAEARHAAAEAIEAASEKLHRLSLSSAYPLPETERRSGFQGIIDILQAAPDGTDEQAAAKHGMMAKARMELARLELEKARDLDHVIAMEISFLGKLADIAVEQDVMARGGESYDFSEVYRDLEALEQDAKSSRSELSRSRQSLEERIREFEESISREASKASTLREEAATVKFQAEDAELDDRERMIYEARDIGREADRHAVTAAETEAQLETVRPELSETQARISQTETALTSYETSRGVLREREDRAQREATQLRQDLAETVGRLRVDFENLAEEIETALTDRYGAAQQQADQAVQSARTAQTKSRNDTSAFRLATALQLSGQTHVERALSLRSYEALIAKLVANADTLERGGQDQALLDEIASRIEEDLLAAEEAFREAKELVETTSPDATAAQDAKARLLFGLDQGIAAATGADMPEAPRPTPRATTPVASAGGTPPVPANELFDRVADALERRDFGSVTSFFHADTSEEVELLAIIQRVTDSIERLDSACQSNFGRGIGEIFTDPEIIETIETSITSLTGQDVGLSALMGPDPAQEAAAFDELVRQFRDESASMVIEYDSAGTTAWLPDEPNMEDVVLVYVDGQWKFGMDLEPIREGSIMFAAMVGAPEGTGPVGLTEMFVEPALTAIQGVTTRVESGEYGDEFTMVQGLIGEITQEYAKIMAQMNPGGQQPGGFGFPGGGGGGG